MADVEDGSGLDQCVHVGRGCRRVGGFGLVACRVAGPQIAESKLHLLFHVLHLWGWLWWPSALDGTCGLIRAALPSETQPVPITLDQSALLHGDEVVGSDDEVV